MAVAPDHTIAHVPDNRESAILLAETITRPHRSGV